MTTATPVFKQTGSQLVYLFGENVEPPPLDKNLLGGKGNGLAEMASIGMPVPPGFIITTMACNYFRKSGRHIPDDLENEIYHSMKSLEEMTGRGFGSEHHPLLVSVRSGARVSMPGMMDTVLNLGLNDRSVLGIEDQRFAYDSYRRFIIMYADIVEGVRREYFDDAFEVIKIQQGVTKDSEVSLSNLQDACHIFKELFEKHARKPFPQDAQEQLFEAIKAVFNSWDSERATLYRQLHKYPDDWGTAVNVQMMVFGNRNQQSATGVGFTRDPASGVNNFYGEYLPNAQGEEVVAGIRTPQPINIHQKEMSNSHLPTLEDEMPHVYRELYEIVNKLERHYQDMQDIEFTIDDGKLYMLQTRTGKRTGFAAVKMAAEMLKEGLINEKTALKRIDPEQIGQLLAPVFDQKAKDNAKKFFAGKGLNAGPGAASGQIAFTSEKAVEMKQKGKRSILVREEASPDDFPGMVAAEGILTIRGGSTSHAAVVARGMGKPCIVGCGDLTLNKTNGTLSSKNMIFREGDSISIDGLTGEVYFSSLPTSPSEIVQVLIEKTKKPEDSLIYQDYKMIMDLADKYRTLKVRTNADTPQDSAVARAFGAEGIGLCRTEHMLMDTNRLNDVRCMFFSTVPDDRKRAVNKLLPHQKNDFIEIFRVMDGLPVTIRLLDPPLHEFMPHSEDELTVLANLMGVSKQKLAEIKSSLEEQNPMLGLRGCRLGIIYPEVTKMQTQAILEAAITVQLEGKTVIPEIMIPLIGSHKELFHQKLIIDQTAKELFKELNSSIEYHVGTMIELPRAALTADEIAEDAQFFSFGTNDLTQTTFGISRDDSSKFVPLYIKGVPNPLQNDMNMQIFLEEPFQVIDRNGVGKLMRIAVEDGRRTNPNLICGICGEHGGEPQSVAFCHEIGLNYVSCSPYRVPVARLSAAVASLQKQ